MKYTLTTLSVFISIACLSQNTVIAPVIQARDCEVIGYYTRATDDYQDLDSVLKSKFRPAFSAPSGTTNVTVNGATNGTWAQLMYTLRRDAYVSFGNNSVFSRIDAALRALSNTYLTAQLDADATAFDNLLTDRRGDGRSRLKHEKNL